MDLYKLGCNSESRVHIILCGCMPVNLIITSLTFILALSVPLLKRWDLLHCTPSTVLICDHLSL